MVRLKEGEQKYSGVLKELGAGTLPNEVPGGS